MSRPSGEARRRDSLASFDGSDLVDDLVFTRPRGTSPATGYAYDFTTSTPDYDSSVDLEHGGQSPALPASTSTSAPSTSGQPAPQASNRSRARAFSFLSVHQQGGVGSAGLATPGGFSSPFSGGAYHSALDDDDDHDDDNDRSSEADDVIDGLDRTHGSSSGDNYPLSRIGTQTSTSASAPNRTVYRVRFQPLDGYELAGMASSAIAVLALTATALVVAIVG